MICYSYSIKLNNSETEQYIKSIYGNNQNNLVDDFLLFIKTELVVNDLKKGFDEVELY